MTKGLQVHELAPRKTPSKTATVRIGTALAVPEVLRSLGADPEAVLAAAGWSLDWFEDLERLIQA